MRVTEASLRAMRRRAKDNLSLGTSRRPRNSLLAQLRQAAQDVERLCEALDLERAKVLQLQARAQLKR